MMVTPHSTAKNEIAFILTTLYKDTKGYDVFIMLERILCITRLQFDEEFLR